MDGYLDIPARANHLRNRALLNAQGVSKPLLCALIGEVFT